MGFYGDYHTHTVFSHGKGSIEENVLAARRLGLKAIAITDHGICNYPQNLHPDEVPNYIAEIERCRELYPDIEILIGAEVNLISADGDLDLNDECEKLLDIIIFGWHGARVPPKVNDCVDFWVPNKMPLLKSTKSVMIKNTDAYLKAMQKHRVSVIAHPHRGARIDLKPIGELAKELGVFVEINSKSMLLTQTEFEMLGNIGCKFVCSSDAHTPEKVGDFSGADTFFESGIDHSLLSNYDKKPKFN